MAAGNIAVPCRWEFHADGTQSQTLTLPQGLMTAQGTFTTQNGGLTQRTTSRIIVIGGEQTALPLSNPMATAFQYQITGSTLTLTQTDTHRKVTLMRTHDGS